MSELGLFEQQTIFSSHIDKEKTQRNVKRLLKDELPRLERIAGESLIKAASMDGMPKAPSRGNSQEDRIVQRLTAHEIIVASIKAIHACSATSERVLDMLYLQKMSDTMVYMTIGYQKSQFYNHVKPKALMEFSEAFMYDDIKAYK